MNFYNSPKSIILFIIDLGILFGGLGIVLSKKIIYSALYLGLVFICIALLYLYLNADFMAATQILIYVGAVNVIILFAIMLINKPELIKDNSITVTDILSGIVSSFLFLLLIFSIFNTKWLELDTINNQNNIINSSNNKIESIGIYLLTDYLLAFELLSVLLLIALVGAINIAQKDDTLEIK